MNKQAFYSCLKQNWRVIPVILAYISIQSYCIQRLSVNYDEGLFAYYGTTILKLQGNKDVIKFDSKLPITALNMLPRAAEQLFQPQLKRPDSDTDIYRGRYVSLLASVMLALLVLHWSARLYGKKAGMLSFLVFLLCPNFLAHGIFVSSDIFACLFMTACFYFLWRFHKTGKVWDFVWSAFFTGMAQVSKFSMVHLLFLIPLLMVCLSVFRAGVFATQSSRLKKLLGLLGLFAGINWIVICAGHLFYGMFVPLNDYHFRSITFQHLQSAFASVGSWLYVLFPSSYIESMDIVMYYDHIGGGKPGSLNGEPYILGQRNATGFWYYYFVVMWFKLTISVLVVICLSVFLYFRKYGYRNFISDELYLLVPAAYFLVYLNFFYSTQLGIRHIMIVLPLLYIFAGTVMKYFSGKKGSYFIYALLIYQVISVGAYFPHFLPYTNEFITNKKLAYKVIADTNICYGEGAAFLNEYMASHPEAKYLPEKICAGRIIMEVNEMLNLNIATIGKFDWVRALTPSDHIHSQYLIFDVNQAMADSLMKKPVN